MVPRLSDLSEVRVYCVYKLITKDIHSGKSVSTLKYSLTWLCLKLNCFLVSSKRCKLRPDPSFAG